MQEYKIFTLKGEYWKMTISSPRYNILETVEDRITGTIWHKLETNDEATNLILNLKSSKSYELNTEITGKSFIWVTDQLLTLLKIQGMEQGIQ